MDVILLGGAGMDIFAGGLSRLPQVDASGDEFSSTSLVHLQSAPHFTIGGNAGNAAYALGRLGCDVHLVTSLGDDLPGRQVKAWLREVGCRVTVLPPKDRTSVNFVATSVAHDRSSFFYPVRSEPDAAEGALQSLSFEKGEHLMLRGYPHPEGSILRRWAEHAQAEEATVSLDIGPALAGFRLNDLTPLLPQIDLLYGNPDEVGALDASLSREHVIDALCTDLRRGVVLKKGRAGATFFTRHRRHDASAFEVQVTTTVGAGDVFDAAFVYKHVVEGTPPAQSLSFACAAAAITLRRGRGPLGAPTAAEVRDFLSTHTKNEA